ncbi:MAG: ABC transporter ATP-binding protein [Fidelibacterota bacterium]|nr:MAG: ABC transporter ATP-binding protein [Candidatus Neomarinimicrobiota bacterium]
MSAKPLLLEIKNLDVNFYLDEGTVEAVQDVSLDIYQDYALGIVGESGCGKSVLSQAIMRIVPRPGEITGGELVYHGHNSHPVDIAKLDGTGKAIRAIRGNEIALILQEPMAALSPLYTVGNQIRDALFQHTSMSRNEARDYIIELLDQVGIPQPETRIDQYPFELSGGLRQRVVIAMAIACKPKLLIADEPTTALDVTIQAQILKLFQELKDSLEISIIFISHDLAVISEIADEVAVMYNGRVVEKGPASKVFAEPLHPYTVGLLKSVPKLGVKSRERLTVIEGSVPDPFMKYKGCAFHPRCSIREEVCTVQCPTLKTLEQEREVACFPIQGNTGGTE